MGWGQAPHHPTPARCRGPWRWEDAKPQPQCPLRAGLPPTGLPPALPKTLWGFAPPPQFLGHLTWVTASLNPSSRDEVLQLLDTARVRGHPAPHGDVPPVPPVPPPDPVLALCPTAAEGAAPADDAGAGQHPQPVRPLPPAHLARRRGADPAHPHARDRRSLLPARRRPAPPHPQNGCGRPAGVPARRG